MTDVSPLRICVMARGTRGDVEPLTEVVRKLVAARHQVRFVTNPIYRETVEECGAVWVDDASDDPREVMQAEAARSGQWTRRTNLFQRLWFAWRNMGMPVTALRVLSEEARRSDAVLYNSMCSPGYLAAAAAGVPAIGLAVSVYLPSRCHSKAIGPIFQHRMRLPGLYNLAVPWLFSFYLWSGDRHWLRPWCAELGIPVPGFREWTLQPRAPRLAGFSPRILPRPTDWPSGHEVTGFWYSESTLARARAALDGSARHPVKTVYSYFGSNSAATDPVADQVILPVLQEEGMRVLTAERWDGRGERTDYRDTLAEADLVVHHGGVGTAGLVTQFGRPSLVVPALGEQRFWGVQLEKAGLCPRVVPRQILDRDSFRRALREVIQDPTYAARARELGKAMLGESGAENACARILGILGNRRDRT